MKFCTTMERQHIKVEVQTKDDSKIFKYLIGSKVDKTKKSCLCEDCLINRLVLNMELPENKIHYTKDVATDTRLHAYQVADVRKMLHTGNCLNANRMGYGKTIEAIKALSMMDFNHALVISPKSIMYQWKAQIEAWFPKYVGKVYVLDGSKKSLEMLQRKEPGIYILNYAKTIVNRFYMPLKSILWDIIIADEAHRIKSPKAKQSVATCSLPAKYRWAMTGTPILNKPDDLFGILRFVDPFLVGKSYWNFRAYFCKLVQGPFGIVNEGLTEDPIKLKILYALLDYCTITNPNLNLTPGKDIEIVKLKMDSKQKTMYNRAKNLIIDELPENLTIPNGAVKCLRLQQITSCPITWDRSIPGVKFEYIKELLEDHPNEKFVVFSAFATTCYELQKYLGDKCTLYVGALDDVTRFENRQTFINDSKCQVIAGTIGAMGEGVDGLQNVCYNVIFMDRDWSPEILEQCEDRLNRIGQLHRVEVKYLECLGTYDRHVGRVTLKKSEDIKRILMSEEGE